ncbi:hypothetical protein K402DRAFT_332028 [Aulographum hederae CBS 113979]|uniref:START domain-containing protein n=1 Tax=Aulographum hederae CBS 113979 TaxID=1176131 RepID=A0A6G1H0W6_9PEZI|nr:hypothetical protein K402DRAFT_332028 [Aulographum hederae CBS 113979]
MSRLRDALQALRPKDYAEVPLDKLDSFLRDTFSQAEVVANSVPNAPGGDSFLTSSLKRNDGPNSATDASSMVVSSARLPPPDTSLAELHEQWGKPLKINARDNPLGITVWKMAGHDRHGAWFARRSVHEGLGFTKWKKAMQREFPVSLRVQAGPGEGSVRGIGGDTRLERKVVEGLGKMEVVYQLSARFPSPVSPREFITLLLTTDSGLSDLSTIQGEDIPRSSQIIPRHYMVVSVPVTHPDAPPRDGLVRGQYESVEMIREIPLPSTKDPEENPVEWIMITRSDPGGGIPRFMVDRNTPSSIVADTSKFLNWACAMEDLPSDDSSGVEGNTPSDDDFDTDIESPEAKNRGGSFSAAQANGHLAGVESSKEAQKSSEGGLLNSLTTMVGSGVANYTPSLNPDDFAPTLRPKSKNAIPGDFDSDESTETSSLNSFASAEQFNTAPEREYSSDEEEDTDTSPAQLNNKATTDIKESDSASTISLPSRHDKELAKLDAKKKQLDEKLAKTREREEQRISQASEKSEKDAVKSKERLERDYKKQEERHSRELRKLEERKEKEAKKMEERKRKAAEKDVLTKTQRERDEYRQRVDVLSKENGLLKEQMEALKSQVGELQRENTLIVNKVGRMGEGQQVLRKVREQVKAEDGGLGVRRRRSSLAGSEKSGRSEKSAASGGGNGKDEVGHKE